MRDNLTHSRAFASNPLLYLFIYGAQVALETGVLWFGLSVFMGGPVPYFPLYPWVLGAHVSIHFLYYFFTSGAPPRDRGY